MSHKKPITEDQLETLWCMIGKGYLKVQMQVECHLTKNHLRRCLEVIGGATGVRRKYPQEMLDDFAKRYREGMRQTEFREMGFSDALYHYLRSRTIPKTRAKHQSSSPMANPSEEELETAWCMTGAGLGRKRISVALETHPYYAGICMTVLEQRQANNGARWSRFTKQQIANDVAMGTLRRDIIKKYGISSSGLTRIRKEYGIKTHEAQVRKALAKSEPLPVNKATRTSVKKLTHNEWMALIERRKAAKVVLVG